VYDLQAIAVGELSFHPLAAGHDIEIQFDSHAVGLHSQMLDQATERDGPLDEVIVAVDHEFHLC
jgi:hypothetical protein